MTAASTASVLARSTALARWSPVCIVFGSSDSASLAQAGTSVPALRAAHTTRP